MGVLYLCKRSLLHFGIIFIYKQWLTLRTQDFSTWKNKFSRSSIDYIEWGSRQRRWDLFPAAYQSAVPNIQWAGASEGLRLRFIEPSEPLVYASSNLGILWLGFVEALVAYGHSSSNPCITWLAFDRGSNSRAVFRPQRAKSSYIIYIHLIITSM